ncbi:hypothetical protein EXN66_Car000913 [Channa argus]|uniref:Uncharacterized protein n=1 Tax=Channa argus TaxID=215402 RepID=A0A6G1QYH1_CHAAH|nr:hypothetical protein EXN66_Car000913 [Channa argus]KAK2921374.1 hypothetical protein Q8A73_000859 [Channa argus]
MACGVHLGILLVCLVQAEHVCCLWASQAQSDTYVGFSQQDNGLKKPGGSSPQNGFRQASVSTGSAQNSDRETAVISGHSQRFSSSETSKNVPQEAYNSKALVGLVASSLESKPAKRKSNWLRVHLKKGFEKKSFNLYNPIASGSSISNFNKNQNSQTSERKPTFSTKYLPSNSPFGGSHFFSPPSQSAAQRPAYYEQRGSSSSLLSTGAGSRQHNSAWLQPSACGLGRRVPLHHHSGVSEPSPFLLPLSKNTINNPSQAEAGKLYHNYQLPESRGSYNPVNMVSNHASYSQDLPVSPHKQNALVDHDPYSHTLKSPGRGSFKPSCPSVQQVPSSASSSKESWNNRNLTQGAHDLTVFGSSREGASAQRFAPSRTYSVPQSFGGYAIRRLKKPANQKEEGALNPQQTDAPSPQQPAASKPKFYRVPQRSKWIRIKPGSLTQQVLQNESDLK